MTLTRSENMARIRGQDTGPERILRDALVEVGTPVVRHQKTPFGRPDLVVSDRKIAIFVDGCFWHGCPDHYVRPGSREEFWATRLRVNIERDRRQTLDLERAGWTVVRAWEHEVFTDLPAVVARVRAALDPPDVCAPSPAWRVVQVDVLDPVTRLERRHLVDLRDPELRQESDGRRRTTQWRRRGSRGILTTTRPPRDPDARR